LAHNYLIVAADGKVREALSADLRQQGHGVTLAETGAEAERVARSVSVQWALVESHLPDMSGEDLRARLAEARPECRVVVLTSFRLVRGTPELLRFGADDYLVRRSQIFDLLDPRRDADRPAADDVGIQALVQTIDVLVSLLELEHRHFASSSHQAMQLARATAEELGADRGLLQEVVLGALLRDVGQVVAEPAKDRAGARKRAAGKVAASVRLFEHIGFPWKVLPVIRHYHENYDGSGQPDGLRGREIPMAARVVAVVDAYVAMTCAKAGESLAPEQALEELIRGAGQRFDSEVVEAFHRALARRLVGRPAKGRSGVLLLEPDEQFRKLIKVRLRDEGMSVEEAPDFQKCLQRVLDEPPQLVLLDVDADPAEAFGLLNEMQQDDSLCRIPVAFLSQRADRLLRLRALRAGVADFLRKSLDLEELAARVENMLVRESIRAEGEGRRARRGITGNLENMSLPDIVQMLIVGLKTACVTLSCAAGKGRLWFDRGTLRHAEANADLGEPAFYEMLRWTEGSFVVEHGVRSPRETIDHDAMFLLMEGLRLLDEQSSGGAAQAAS
jgi:response regulator RpfG family c-di-GMP phosphodiesterase